MVVDPLSADELASETRALLSRRGVGEALRLLDLRPSRRFGQHFLVEPVVLQRVLEAAALEPGDVVLEVGPGLGALTAELLRRAGRVVAVEVDRRLCAWLRERFAGFPHLTLVEEDILKLDPTALLGSAQPYKVVANLPYAITSALLRHLLEAPLRPSRLVVMVQWEVAQRITAGPPEMSLLGLSVQYYTHAKLVTRVPAGCFLPRPKVDSAVLQLEVSPGPRVPIPPDAFFRLIRLGFAHPRRQLGKNLAAGLQQPRAPVDAALAKAGIDPRRRAETVSLEEWETLYRVFDELVRR